MKIKLYSLLICMAAWMSSCESLDMRSYPLPELKTPEYKNEKNLTFITIAELKALYPVDSYDGHNRIEGTKKALKARVSANDESGNLYKTLYLQDESGAIAIGVDRTGLFPHFMVGQEVVVELDGLGVGRYAGSYQIGSAKPSFYRDKPQMDRMTGVDFLSHVFRNGTPDPAAVSPKVLDTLPLDVTEEIRGTLVRFDGVQFELGGKATFFDFSRPKGKVTDGNRYLLVDGKKALLHSSEYAKFAADTLPEGMGSIICLLTRYQRGMRDDVQLIIRGREDLIFDK